MVAKTNYNLVKVMYLKNSNLITARFFCAL